ncbi:DUF2971 domain-containing protein [Paraclostridium sordellii]|uniref:DUF2971 domain-containing protein n=1 Tax=Paraclostridium sordellii TaxID=1505 RepID=A0A9P1PBE3_PARSO|nr:DUF2971 domain-containing protein [Paeniclostridium sordellii]CEO33231.1 Uncharacterised protein [[Clostridium] sordellii] [Paeniclostridium sordellii]
MKKDLLYHYTSIETLALILKNKTICFNNLLNVDDLEEASTQDMGNFGKYINVSCWTEDSEESIPLWNLYTPNMKGVRIGLPKFPFKKYHFSAGEYNLSEDVDTYIDLEWLYNSNCGGIVVEMPLLREVKYTNDENKLFPKVRQCNDIDGLKEFIETGECKGKEVSTSYSLRELGVYKRLNWSFQQEWRYIISSSPINIKEKPTIELHRETVRRIEDTEYPAPFDKIFLSVDEKYFEKMEILIGPKVSDGDKIIIESLVNKYAPNATINESKLKIR